MSFGGSSYQQADPAELAAAQSALTDWLDLKPQLQKTATASVGRAVNADKRNALQLGRIGASTSQVLDAAQAGSNTAMMQRGVAPTSGAFLMGNNGVARTAGLGKALAKGVLGNEQSYMMGLGRVLNQGQGLKGSVDSARNSLAGMAAGDRAMDTTTSNANSAMLGQAIGAGIGTFSMAGGFDAKAPKTPKPKGVNYSNTYSPWQNPNTSAISVASPWGNG